ncbi:MAG TPA: ABC transporter permease [Thermoanaerobaculia bacterium]|nr:ABC transporter permease [Thermoanaerobaculia bacterium]
MRFRDLLAFSAGALRGHRLRTGLSLAGVAIGVASVILLTSLGEGARLYVTGEFASLGSNLLILFPGKTETTGMSPFVTGAPHDLTLDDAEAIARRVRQARRVAPVVFGLATARFGDRGRDIGVWGATAEMLGVRKIRLATGQYLPAGDVERGQRVCVIGAKVKEELFAGANPLGELLRLGNERFRVIGVMAPRGTSIGVDFDEMVHIPVSRGMKMFNKTTLFRVLIEVSSHEEIPAARAAVIELVKERHGGVEDVTVWTQDAVVSTFSRILALLTATLAGIAAISLTVAGVGIMNVMLVSVSERTREIGLLKAIGATGGQVVAAFLVEAAILSTAGGAAGLAVAFGLTRLLRALYPSFPVQPPDWAVGAAVLVSVGVGLLFGAMPAKRAARLDPIAALARR